MKPILLEARRAKQARALKAISAKRNPLRSVECGISRYHHLCKQARKGGMPCYCPCHFPTVSRPGWTCAHARHGYWWVVGVKPAYVMSDRQRRATQAWKSPAMRVKPLRGLDNR